MTMLSCALSRLLLSLLVLLVSMGGAACAPAAHVSKPALPEHPEAPRFQAEAVDVAIDWDAHPEDRGGALGAPSAKMSLTASDGSGLKLASLDARAVLYGPIAFTEIHLVFSNPEPTTREGTFAIALPEGAAVSRFAMRLPQGWQEGEVVERQAARATYESFMRKRVDPALLEHDAGTNMFRGRVFPIFGRQDKEIVISYTQTLALANEPYRMSLRGLPPLDQLDVQLLVPSRNKAFVLHRSAYTPDRDFVYTPPPGTSDAVRGGRFAAVRVSAAPASKPAVAAASTTQQAPIGSLAVLIDSSASHTGTFVDDVAKVARIVDALHPTSLKVACFDQEVVESTSLADAAKRRPAGASDLARGLRWLQTSGATRAIVVTDGRVTVGSSETFEKSIESLKDALRTSGVERLDALAVGGSSANNTTLQNLVLSGLARDGVVIDGASVAPEAAASALRGVGGQVGRVEVVGAAKAFPSSLASVGTKAPAAIAFVEIDEDKPLRVVLNGRSTNEIAHADVAPAAFVERVVAEARIRELGAERSSSKTTAAQREELAREIVTLSVRHRVLTDLTAMLVLETDYDYQRFNIPRDAMKDIPVVGPRGVEIIPRGGGHVLLPPSATRNTSPLLDTSGRDGAAANVDTDRDGIPDSMDKCPNEPETFNGFEDEDGCPDRGRILIENSNIIILQMIRFRMDSAAILPESLPIIDAVAAVLAHNPALSLVGLMGHTDDRGSAAFNKELSLRRANAVRDALIARGVEAKRLIAKGFGGAFPIERNDTLEGREKNRRVELKILVANGESTGVEEVPTFPPPPRETTLSRGPTNMRLGRNKPFPRGEALSGKLAEVTKLIEDKKSDQALTKADEWVRASPNDMLAWIAQGRALETLNRSPEAARSYGSVLELASRAEHRRAAAGWLEALGTRHRPALDLAIEAYRSALDELPDHPSSHRLYAWSLARAGRVAEALEVTLPAIHRSFEKQRFPGASDVFKADAGIFATVLSHGKPASEGAAILKRALAQRLEASGATFAKGAVTQLALTWETDESDLDLLLTDSKDNRVIFAPVDVRSGFGPELLSLKRDAAQGQGPSKLEVHQVTRGPQGFAFGKVAIVHHDGKGTLVFDDRPFVLMNENAAIQLGTIAPR